MSILGPDTTSNRGQAAFDENAARSELAEVFGESAMKDELVMAECLSICRLYNISPNELFYKNEALILSRPSGSTTTSGAGAVAASSMNLVQAKDLRRAVQAGLASKQQSTAHVAHATPGIGASARKMAGAVNGLGDFLDSLSTPSRSPGGSSSSRPRGGPSTTSAASHTPLAHITPVPSRVGAGHANAFSTPTRPTASASGSTQRDIGNGGDRGMTNGHSIEKSYGARSSPATTGNGAGDSPLANISRPTVPFNDRRNPMEVLETLNSHIPQGTGIPYGVTRKRVNVTSDIQPGDFEYRYMFEKISEKSLSELWPSYRNPPRMLNFGHQSTSTVLDNIIDDFADNMQVSYGLNEIADPSMISTEDVVVVGRIISLPTDSGKPTESSLLLETSRQLGDGKRTPLRFSPNVKVRGNAPGVKGFGVFPGCLVCLKGRNGGGGTFQVEEVLLPPPSDMNVTPPSELYAYQHQRMAGEPCSVIVASGPYTLDTDLSYEPLEALLEAVRVDRPDVLILLGPFVDSKHPLIEAGDVDETPNQLFASQISSRLALLAEECPAMMTILIPSVRDNVSQHVAFPQGALSSNLGLPKRVRVLPNPCSININEVNICLSSIDVLFHLRREEYFRRAEEVVPSDPKILKDSMAELCRHILGQKSFYPIFPCPEEYASEVNLDMTHFDKLQLVRTSPDILILPSRLKHFAKIVDSVVAVNPSSLTKAASPGTFSKITIRPTDSNVLKKSIESGDEPVEHRVYDRVRVDLVRI